MKQLQINTEIQELTIHEMTKINGGNGEWHWQEALYCAFYAGPGGLIVYTIGTMVN